MQVHKFIALALAAFVMLGALLVMPLVAQTPVPPQQQGSQPEQQTRPRTATTTTSSDKPGERLEPDDTSAPPRADISAEMLANRRASKSEEAAAIRPYYNNFLSTYILGPEDVISIIVAGPYQDRYSKSGITVPPDGTISHLLVPDGVSVVGKTVKQVQDELTGLFEEYIIDPKVTVSLDKAQSAIFWVMGDVAAPGVRVISRRLSVTEAIAISGGVLPTGSKKKVTILRRGPDNYLQTIKVDVAAIEKGKRPDDTFLVAGDQLVVPGNTFKTIQKYMQIIPIFSLFRAAATGSIF
ncbi:MAG: polysaccharide export protein [Acidobacteriota bacterium]|nr:polysaccharide export protein [Acidobacteriota bacterium]